MELFESSCENIRVVVHFSQQYSLIEELDAKLAKLLDADLGFLGHLANMIEVCYKQRSLSCQSSVDE